MSVNYEPLLKEKWPDSYFDKRKSNDSKRLMQFRLDKAFIYRFIQEGNICDIGCSTGEFLKSLDWKGRLYGMEINDHARTIASEFISFEKNIFTEKDFFDLVIFRGTIQHVDEPFRMIKSAYKSIKTGGYIVFLATPNTNSILYKIKEDLAMLDPQLNFFLPGDRELINAMRNFGFHSIVAEYPYLNTPYCSLVKDHFRFLLNLFSMKFFPHPFWKSSMNVIGRK